MISRGARREDTVANVTKMSPGMGETVTEVGEREEDSETRERASSLLSDPRAISLCLLALYLATTAGVLARSHATRLIVVHVLLLGIVAWTIKPRSGVAAAIGDLLPLVVAPLLYGEIPSLVAAIGSVYHD